VLKQPGVPREGGLGGEGWRRPNTLQGASALGARIENQGLRAELRWDKLGKYARYTRQEESVSLPRESGRAGGLAFVSFVRSLARAASMLRFRRSASGLNIQLRARNGEPCISEIFVRRGAIISAARATPLVVSGGGGEGAAGWRNASPVEEARLAAFPARGIARQCASFRESLSRASRETRESARESNRLLTRVWKRINSVCTSRMLITAHVQDEMIVVARDVNKRNIIALSLRSRIGCTILYLYEYLK